MMFLYHYVKLKPPPNQTEYMGYAKMRMRNGTDGVKIRNGYGVKMRNGTDLGIKS